MHSNPVGSIAAGVILLVLLFKRPKLLFILLLLSAVGTGFMYIYDKIALKFIH
jgi:hypothetical protein